MRTATALAPIPTTPDAIIDEFMGVTHKPTGKKVYAYGTAKWIQPTTTTWLLWQPYGKVREKAVTLMQAGITKYRDGDSGEFLLEMPEAYAAVYDIESYVLSEADLDRLKQRIDMTRPW
jgi:hypothetical protein